MFIVSGDVTATNFLLGESSDITVTAVPSATNTQIINVLNKIITWLQNSGDSDTAVGSGQSGSMTLS